MSLSEATTRRLVESGKNASYSDSINQKAGTGAKENRTIKRHSPH